MYQINLCLLGPKHPVKRIKNKWLKKILAIYRASYKNDDTEKNVEVENVQCFKFSICPQTLSYAL
jgi:hypothetical protein